MGAVRRGGAWGGFIYLFIHDVLEVGLEIQWEGKNGSAFIKIGVLGKCGCPGGHHCSESNREQ